MEMNQRKGNRHVLSLESAQRRFGKLPLWICVAAGGKEAVRDFLLKSGIDENCILNGKLVPTCNFMRRNMIVEDNALYYCCRNIGMPSNIPRVAWFPSRENIDFDAMTDEFIDVKKKHLESIQKKTPCACSGCAYITNSWDYEHESDSLSVAEIAFGLDSPCQLSCSYCKAYNARNKTSDENKFFVRNFDYVRFFSVLEKKRILDDAASVTFASGELTLDPRIDEILDAVEKYSICVLTNGVVFNERIAKLLSRSGSSMNISLDSGTRETYAKVKGLDAYDAVVKNIEKYAQYAKIGGGGLSLKYIFLPENTNEKDVEGFIRVATNVGASSISIATDIFKEYEFTDVDIGLMAKMAQLARDNTIPYGIANEIPVADAERIKRLL